MKDKTQEGYEKLYAAFVKNIEGDVTPQKLANELVERARGGISKSYWYRLKTALKHVQAAGGYTKGVAKVDATTWPKDGIATKRHDAKKVTQDDYAKLTEFLLKHGNEIEHSAVVIAYHTGMRPDEMSSAYFNENNELVIIGSKKNEKLQRGADRVIKFGDDGINKEIRSHLDKLQTSGRSKETIQTTISRATHEAFKRRKSPPTLKSFRHQFGSELKALITHGKMSKQEAAYLLGHQSTESLDRYGDVRCGNGMRISVEASPESKADIANVRVVEKSLETFKSKDKTSQKMQDMSTSRNNSGIDFGF
jgi:hypothetical protein